MATSISMEPQNREVKVGAPMTQPAPSSSSIVSVRREIVDNFTAEERQALADMRLRLPPLSPRGRTAASTNGMTASMLEDHTLMRFLRARAMDVPIATEMYLAAQHWRRMNGIDNVSTRAAPANFALLQQVVPQEWHGVDRQGRPIMIQKIGQMHLDIFTKWDTEVIDECHTYMMELGQHLMRLQSDRTGQRVTQKVIIIDLQGLGFGHRHTIKFMKGTSHIDKNFYPETLGQLFMINAPRIAPALWAMIKPMLDAKTQAKVQILGHDYAAKLQEYIAPEQLPKELGGRCTCRGDKCLLEYPVAHVKKAMEGYAPRRRLTDKITEAPIAAKARLEVPLEVTAVRGQEFMYSFSTAKNDIMFSVEFIPLADKHKLSIGSSKDKTKEEYKPMIIAEVARVVASAEAPSTGAVTAPAAGIIRFVFDNAHSRFSAKTIFYSIAAGQEVAEDTVTAAPTLPNVTTTAVAAR